MSAISDSCYDCEVHGLLLLATIANFLGSWAQKALSFCCKHFYREHSFAKDPHHHGYGQSNVLVWLLYRQPSNPDNIRLQTARSYINKSCEILPLISTNLPLPEAQVFRLSSPSEPCTRSSSPTCAHAFLSPSYNVNHEVRRAFRHACHCSRRDATWWLEQQ